mgnify:FL=1
MISRSTIDQVYEAARVEEVIGDFISLKKSGSNFKGLSPFSQERTPSFMVSPVKQIWKDFSSGKGGNVVAFLMEHEHFTYPESIEFLAKKYNIEIEKTEQSTAEKEKTNQRESLFLVNKFAQEQFSKDLWEFSEGMAIGLSYFRERGFSDDTIRFFGLGYSAQQRDHFFKKLIKSGYLEKNIIDTGLVIKNDRGIVDRFRGRVIFPIRSMAGRIQGFGGRILSSNLKTAKYLNSPESDIYHKSQVLYGIYEAKKAIVREDICFLVEGYTDVIQMYQKGIENIVSSSGTALSSEQIQLIRRLTSNVVVLFDGDAAGLRAAIRGIDLILEQGMNVRICSFPEGEDPDSFAKSHSLDEIKNYLLDEAKDFIQFKTDLLLKEAANDPVKKATTIREIVQSISKIPDAIKQEIYIRECASQMEVSEVILFNTLAQEKNKKSVPVRKIDSNMDKQVLSNQKSDIKSKSVNPIILLEKQIISILLQYGNDEASFDELLVSSDKEGNLIEESKTVHSKVHEKIFLDLQQDEVEMIQPEFQSLYSQLIEKFQIEGKVQLEKIIHQEDPNLGKILTDILLADEEHQLHNWEKKNIFVKDRKSVVGQLVTETILTFRRYLVDEKIKNLMNVAKQLNLKNKDPDFLEEVMQYQGLKKLLSRKLNRVI